MPEPLLGKLMQEDSKFDIRICHKIGGGGENRKKGNEGKGKNGKNRYDKGERRV